MVNTLFIFLTLLQLEQYIFAIPVSYECFKGTRRRPFGWKLLFDKYILNIAVVSGGFAAGFIPSPVDIRRSALIYLRDNTL